MASDPPIDPPNEETAAPPAPAEPAETAEVVAGEPAEPAAVVAAEPAEPAAPAADATPSPPASPAKEWAVAIAIMIVFAIICAQFISFLRSNQYGGPGP